MTAMQRKEITISMDKNLYEKFAEVCDKTGISIQTAFTWFAGMSVIKKSIPVDPSDLVTKEDYKDFQIFRPTEK